MVALFVGSVPAAHSNPLILEPTGTTLTTGQVRAEAALSPGNEHGKYYWLAAGFQQFEFNVIRTENGTGKNENMVGLQWGFLPETIFTPGISFGVRDIASQSAEGIGGYVAVTKHLPLPENSLLKDLGLTAGIGAAGIRGTFFGFQAKLPFNLFAEGEYDSKDFNTAVGWQPISLLKLKAYNIRKDFYIGAELVPISF